MTDTEKEHLVDTLMPHKNIAMLCEQKHPFIPIRIFSLSECIITENAEVISIPFFLPTSSKSLRASQLVLPVWVFHLKCSAHWSVDSYKHHCEDAKTSR